MTLLRRWTDLVFATSSLWIFLTLRLLLDCSSIFYSRSSMNKKQKKCWSKTVELKRKVDSFSPNKQHLITIMIKIRFATILCLTHLSCMAHTDSVIFYALVRKVIVQAFAKLVEFMGFCSIELLTRALFGRIRYRYIFIFEGLSHFGLLFVALKKETIFEICHIKSFL